MEDKVTLYIATHNITGKKYFGKNCIWFTKEDLQKNYHGSGEYWNKHKKKHGKKDVTMEIYKICSLNESDEDYVVPIALKFSKENNIVESEEWANLMFENGLDGSAAGAKRSSETKAKISEGMKNREVHPMTGKKHSEETKAKISDSSKGKKHTEESKAKMSADRKGHLTSEETKAKISEAKKARNIRKKYRK